MPIRIQIRLSNFMPIPDCCGSMTFWCGSGSGSMPLTNGSGFGSGSFFFRHKPSRCQQKTNLKKKFFCILLFEGTFKSFFKDKKSKRSHKTGSGSIHLTDGSGFGSRRLKNMWIRWIWIRIQIRNTVFIHSSVTCQSTLFYFSRQRHRFHDFGQKVLITSGKSVV